MALRTVDSPNPQWLIMTHDLFCGAIKVNSYWPCTSLSHSVASLFNVYTQRPYQSGRGPIMLHINKVITKSFCYFFYWELIVNVISVIDSSFKIQTDGQEFWTTWCQEDNFEWQILPSCTYMYQISQSLWMNMLADTVFRGTCSC